MPTGKIGISVTNPVIEPPPQDRDTVTSFRELDVLPLGFRTRIVCERSLTSNTSKERVSSGGYGYVR